MEAISELDVQADGDGRVFYVHNEPWQRKLRVP